MNSPIICGIRSLGNDTYACLEASRPFHGEQSYGSHMIGMNQRGLIRKREIGSVEVGLESGQRWVGVFVVR